MLCFSSTFEKKKKKTQMRSVTYKCIFFHEITVASLENKNDLTWQKIKEIFMEASHLIR